MPQYRTELESPWHRAQRRSSRYGRQRLHWLKCHHTTTCSEMTPWASHRKTWIKTFPFLISHNRCCTPHIYIYICIYTYVYIHSMLLQAPLSPTPFARPTVCLAKGEWTHSCLAVRWRQIQFYWIWLLLADCLFIFPLQPFCFLWIDCTENWAHAVINMTEYSPFPHENAVRAVLQFHTVTFVMFKRWTALVDTDLHHMLSRTRTLSFDVCREYTSTTIFSLKWQNFPPCQLTAYAPLSLIL